VITDETMSADDVSAHLELERFLPYRLSVLANRVSRAVAKLYEEKFDLKLPEWRVLAVLGRQGEGGPGMTASAIVEVTAMDKVAISRAVSRLIEMGRVAATPDSTDNRRQILCLSSAGWAIYHQVAPLALSVEAQLLNALPPEDRALLDRLLDSLSEAAQALEGATR
jgi:DNA-binding MarR family transcriptional regulator